MKARTAILALAAVLLFASAPRAGAITWFPREFECPVCHTKNTFLTWGSYGSYIYQDPSKFQLIFWPFTDRPTVYTCKKCHLSTFMSDFEDVPKEKHEEILKALEGVKLEYSEAGSAYYKEAEYLKIPVTQRLLAAGAVYKVLGSDDDFWCHFYRVLGYHYEAEENQAKADEARRAALDIALRMLGDKERADRRKEFLVITGAMRHFLRDDAAALRDFREALALKYGNKSLEAENVKNYDEYLTELLREYVKKLGGKPEGDKPGEKKRAA